MFTISVLSSLTLSKAIADDLVFVCPIINVFEIWIGGNKFRSECLEGVTGVGKVDHVGPLKTECPPVLYQASVFICGCGDIKVS